MEYNNIKLRKSRNIQTTENLIYQEEICQAIRENYLKMTYAEGELEQKNVKKIKNYIIFYLIRRQMKVKILISYCLGL